MNETVVTLVDMTHPDCVVELGTGDGATAAAIMGVLPKTSRLTTVNWPNPPSGDDPTRYLLPWLSDPRLTLLLGDTRDPAIVNKVPGNVDLLYIDSTHTYECLQQEWFLYRSKLKWGANVVVDDLDHNDMRRFWSEVTYPKDEFRGGTVGVFRYEPQRHVYLDRAQVLRAPGGDG